MVSKNNLTLKSILSQLKNVFSLGKPMHIKPKLIKLNSPISSGDGGVSSGKINHFFSDVNPVKLTKSIFFPDVKPVKLTDSIVLSDVKPVKLMQSIFFSDVKASASTISIPFSTMQDDSSDVTITLFDRNNAVGSMDQSSFEIEDSSLAKVFNYNAVLEIDDYTSKVDAFLKAEQPYTNKISISTKS